LLTVPLVIFDTPVRVMSLAESPVMAWLKVNVNCVVVTVAEPSALTPLNVTAVLPPPVLVFMVTALLVLLL